MTSSYASQELGNAPLHWQRAAQKEHVPGLHCFNIGAERSWWTRQDYAKVFQSLFGTGVRCVRGHYRFSMDITRGRDYITTDPDSSLAVGSGVSITRLSERIVGLRAVTD